MLTAKRSTRLSTGTMLDIRNIFNSDPMVQTVRQMIHHQLLNNGIQFCMNTCQVVMDDSDPEVNEKWIPFCHDVIDSVICFGIAVVHLPKNKPPSILEDLSYNIELEYTPDFTYKYHVFSRSEVGKKIPNAIVFDHFGCPPSMNGQFNSLMVKVIPRIVFLNNLRNSMQKIEQDRAYPVFFSEIKDSDSNKTKEGVDFDFYAEANSTELDESMKFMRNKTAVSVFNQQKTLYNEYLSSGHAHSSKRKLESVIQLPMGHKIVNPPSVTSRSDFANINRGIQEEICAAFGLPRSIVFSDSSSNVKHDTFGTHQTFMHTLMWWKKKLSILMADCYNIQNLEDIVKNLDFSKSVEKNKSVEELRKENTVRVTFPVTPMVENEDLRKLYEQGVIDFETYGKYVLRNIGLPLDVLQKKRPPIDDLLFEKPEEPSAPPAKKQKVESKEGAPPAKKQKEPMSKPKKTPKPEDQT